MQYRKLGKTDIDVSAVSLGTWAIGGGQWWGDTDEQEAIEAIHAGLDAGINCVDTAPAYGFGQSEETVGKALAGRRSDVVLSTKCGLWWKDSRGSFRFERDGTKVNLSLHPETIREEVEISLKRLKTDYIDILHTHWPSIEPDFTPISETMECLMDLKKQGKIRAIAASNVTVDHIKEHMAAGVLDAIQPRYSMLDRGIEKEISPFCISHSISTMVYSPLEQGLLTGRFGMDYVIPEGQFRNNLPWFQPVNRKRVLQTLEGWKDLTEAYSCSMSQLVIAWTIAQKGITTALCGARKKAHVLDNVGAGSLELKPEDTRRMRKDVEALGDPE